MWSDVCNCCRQIIRIKIAMIKRSHAAFASAGVHPFASINRLESFDDVMEICGALLNVIEFPIFACGYRASKKAMLNLDLICIKSRRESRKSQAENSIPPFLQNHGSRFPPNFLEMPQHKPLRK